VLIEECAGTDAGHSSQDLAHEPAERDGVVPVSGARLPPRRESLQELDHEVPVADVRRAEGLRHARQSSLMVEEHAHRYLALAVAGEAAPVTVNGRIEVKVTGRGKYVGGQCHGPLGC
jgi:hypothetical protein